jgi:streptomycin 6-kinase
MHGELHHGQVLQQGDDAGSIMAPSKLIAGMGNISNPPT